MEVFPYGAVLKIQREQTLQDIFIQMKKIKDLDMNFVVIWPAVYWWEDKKNRNYPYNSGHQILKYAEEIGLKVIMELAGQITCMEYAPDFLMKEEYYAVTYEGHLAKDKLFYGYINYFHPEVKRLIKKQFSEIAENYKSYSSLYGYDIWNETMFQSFDNYTLMEYREWLKRKYKTIDRLNNVWDRLYHDWSQIQFTKWMWSSVMPKVDYHQFHKESIGIILREWRDVIKSADPVHSVIADNVSSMVIEEGAYERPQDDWNVAENVDEFGVSFYPKNAPNIMEDYKRWEMLTGIHSASPSGRFWISELQSHLQMIFNPLSSVYPHELRWWNWEAISHGAKGIIYWMWDPFVKGLQTFGRGLVDIRSNYTKRSEEACTISRIIKENEMEFLSYEPEMPKAGILFDKTNHDFVRAYTAHYKPFIDEGIYLNSIAGLYRCMWEQNIPAKFITQKDILNKSINQYKALFITNQLNISDELSEALESYVYQGGILICDGKFGEIDDFGILHREMPGGKLNEILGCRHIDVDPFNLNMNINFREVQGLELNGYYEKRILEVIDKNVNVPGIFEDGLPAVIETKYGDGSILYISSFLWYGYYKENYLSVYNFMELLNKEYSFSNYIIKDNSLKICTLKGDAGFILFAFNYMEHEIRTDIELIQGDSDGFIIKNLNSGDEKAVYMNNGKLLLDVCVKGKDVGLFKLTACTT